ncbi:hypothetical protein HDU99_001742, partial [Rhizoclosmatium hyalinum]
SKQQKVALDKNRFCLRHTSTSAFDRTYNLPEPILDKLIPDLYDVDDVDDDDGASDSRETKKKRSKKSKKTAPSSTTATKKSSSSKHKKKSSQPLSAEQEFLDLFSDSTNSDQDSDGSIPSEVTPLQSDAEEIVTDTSRNLRSTRSSSRHSSTRKLRQISSVSKRKIIDSDDDDGASVSVSSANKSRPVVVLDDDGFENSFDLLTNHDKSKRETIRHSHSAAIEKRPVVILDDDDDLFKDFSDAQQPTESNHVSLSTSSALNSRSKSVANDDDDFEVTFPDEPLDRTAQTAAVDSSARNIPNIHDVEESDILDAILDHLDKYPANQSSSTSSSIVTSPRIVLDFESESETKKPVRGSRSVTAKKSVTANEDDSFPSDGSSALALPSGSDWSTVPKSAITTWIKKLTSEVPSFANATSFPKHYILLQQKRSTGNHHDKYLYGHPSGSRFRSANEFLPHLRYLAAGLTGVCECKLCGGNRRASAQPSPSSSLKARPRVQLDKTAASVNKTRRSSGGLSRQDVSAEKEVESEEEESPIFAPPPPSVVKSRPRIIVHDLEDDVLDALSVPRSVSKAKKRVIADDDDDVANSEQNLLQPSMSKRKRVEQLDDDEAKPSNIKEIVPPPLALKQKRVVKDDDDDHDAPLKAQDTNDPLGLFENEVESSHPLPPQPTSKPSIRDWLLTAPTSTSKSRPFKSNSVPVKCPEPINDPLGIFDRNALENMFDEDDPLPPPPLVQATSTGGAKKHVIVVSDSESDEEVPLIKRRKVGGGSVSGGLKTR